MKLSLEVCPVDSITVFLADVGSAAGRRLANDGIDLIYQALGMQSAQMQLLVAINAKLDVLLGRPFKTGLQQMKDAEKADSEGDRLRLLQDARASFTEAASVDHNELRCSFAELYLATIWLALGSKDNFLEHLREAHIAAGSGITRRPGLIGRAWCDLRGKQYPPERRGFSYFNQISIARRAWMPSEVLQRKAPQLLSKKNPIEKTLINTIEDIPVIVENRTDGTWVASGDVVIDTDDLEAWAKLPASKRHKGYRTYDKAYSWSSMIVVGRHLGL